MFTVCCYDPRVMETLCNLNAGPVQSHVQPMMTLVCEDAASAAATFYEMFDVLQWMQLSVVLDYNTIYIQFPICGTDRLLNILLHLRQRYTVYQETNSYADGVLYSTTSWVKVPVSVKWNEHAVTK